MGDWSLMITTAPERGSRLGDKSIADVIYLISKNVDLPCNPPGTEASLSLPSVTKGQNYNKSIVYKFAGIAVSSLRVVSLPILQNNFPISVIYPKCGNFDSLLLLI